MKLIASVLFLFLLGIMTMGLFHMSSRMMSGGMENCPFMAHEEALCPMSFTDHVEAWRSTFLAVAPTTLLLLSLFAVAPLLAAVAPNLLVRQFVLQPVLAGMQRERTYTYSRRSLQELFSNGVLHPKLF